VLFYASKCILISGMIGRHMVLFCMAE